MSLLNIFKIKNNEIKRLEQENKILKAQIKFLKKLLFDIDSDKE
jgi:hypothetical protein